MRHFSTCFFLPRRRIIPRPVSRSLVRCQQRVTGKNDGQHPGTHQPNDAGGNALAAQPGAKEEVVGTPAVEAKQEQEWTSFRAMAADYGICGWEWARPGAIHSPPHCEGHWKSEEQDREREREWQKREKRDRGAGRSDGATRTCRRALRGTTSGES